VKRASFGAGAVTEHMGVGYYLGGCARPRMLLDEVGINILFRA